MRLNETRPFPRFSLLAARSSFFRFFCRARLLNTRRPQPVRRDFSASSAQKHRGSRTKQGLKQQADGAQPLSCIIFRPDSFRASTTLGGRGGDPRTLRAGGVPAVSDAKTEGRPTIHTFFFTWTTNKGSANSRARATTKTSGRFPTSISFLFNHPCTDRPLTSFGVCAHNRGSEPALLISARLPGGL